MRNIISFDKQGNLVGEFPHDPLAGFQASRRGLRRRLMNADEVASMTPERALQIAQQRYDVKEKEIREAQFVKDERKRQQAYQRQHMPISTAVKLWHEHLKVTNAERTVKIYLNSLQLYIDLVGDHRLRDFSRAHNIEFLDKLQDIPSTRHKGQALSVNTQHMHIRQLNNFLRWAYDNEYLDKLHRLKKPKLPDKDMEVFSVAQLQQLKQHLLAGIQNATPGRGQVNARNLYRAFMLATNCLMRVGAIASLPLNAIDLDTAMIRVRDVPELGWKNKASKWPNKPINTRLLEFLKEDTASRGTKERWFLDNGYGRTWYVDPSWVSRSMSKAVKAAGLPDGVKPFHWGMRAAMITWLLNNGESPQKVQQLADHADIQTTMKYYNTREASQRDAVERLPEI